MTIYSHILLAVDLQPKDDHPVGKRARSLVKATGAKMSIIHVVEQVSYVYGDPFVSANYLEWQAELEQTAKGTLHRIGENLNIPKSQHYLKVGRAEDQILETAKELKVDLIVVGSHGRHGLQKFVLGSTANGVLQGAECDVLAVRVSNS